MSVPIFHPQKCLASKYLPYTNNPNGPKFRGHSFPENSPEKPCFLIYQQKRIEDFAFHLKARYKSLEHWRGILRFAKCAKLKLAPSLEITTGL
jgi:hypothetical protein